MWNYYGDEPNSNFNNNNQADRCDLKIVMPLKHLRNFWRMLNVPLIICEVSLTLTWSKDYIILNKAKRDAAAATRISSANISGPLSEADGSATNATFKITDTKLYVVLVTLSTKDDNKLLEQLKTRFNRTIK